MADIPIFELDAEGRWRLAYDGRQWVVQHPASSRCSSDNTLPPDFDPDENPILAVHYFGHGLHEVREVFWDLAREGHPLPAQAEIIVLDGGAS